VRRGFSQLLTQFLAVLSQGAISLWHKRFGRINFTAASGLRAIRVAPIKRVDQTKKKICWMKENMTHKGAAIALIDAYRANHPNQLVIRDRISDPKFRS
jgi:hypothetical protein